MVLFQAKIITAREAKEKIVNSKSRIFHLLIVNNLNSSFVRKTQTFRERTNLKFIINDFDIIKEYTVKDIIIYKQ